MASKQPTMEEIVAAAVAAAVQAVAAPQPVASQPEAKSTRVGKGKRKPAAKAPWYQGISTAYLTTGDCWLALGADEKYKPRDESAPANPKQLQALNLSGKLMEMISS